MKRILFCVFAVLLNLLGAWCTRVFELPLYLDSISTIAVAYLCGLAPSLAVAAVTNMVLLFAFESPLVFTLCHLLTAAGSWFIFRFSKTPPIDLFLFAGLLSAATNAVSGSVFSLAMFQGQQKTPIVGLSNCLFYITNSLPFALFVSGIVTNLADKILSAMFSYLLANIIAKYFPHNEKQSVTNSYIDTIVLIFIAVVNIITCFVFQKIYRKISGVSPSLDSSLYLMIVTSIILLAASFMIVYAKMIQVRKEKEVEENRREISKRMSFNLHDGVLQNLVALKTRMESELHKSENSPEIQLVQTAISEIRILCGILRLNDEIPFEESIQTTLAAYEQTYGFKTKLGIACDVSLFSSRQKEELLRILYECLSNAARHSNAKNIDVIFSDDGMGKIYFTVRDDGNASATQSPDQKELHGLGLKSIETRAKNLGGDVHFLQNAEGWSTRVELRIF